MPTCCYFNCKARDNLVKVPFAKERSKYKDTLGNVVTKPLVLAWRRKWLIVCGINGDALRTFAKDNRRDLLKY